MPDTLYSYLDNHWVDAVTRRKRSNRLATEPRAWWQRVIVGERLPNGPLIAKSKCEGTVEDHRAIALDVRELGGGRLLTPVRYLKRTVNEKELPDL